MRRLPLLFTPPAIVIADEPVEDPAAAPAVSGRVSTDGLEVVPAWQARSSRRLRRFSAVVPVVAVLAAGAVWAGRDHDAQAVRERPVAAGAPKSASSRAVVVRAATIGRAGSGGSEAVSRGLPRDCRGGRRAC